MYYPSISSYKILAPKAVEGIADPKKVCLVVLEQIGLDAELYRLGNTKAWIPKKKTLLCVW